MKYLLFILLSSCCSSTPSEAEKQPVVERVQKTALPAEKLLAIYNEHRKDKHTLADVKMGSVSNPEDDFVTDWIRHKSIGVTAVGGSTYVQVSKKDGRIIKIYRTR